MYRPQGTTDDSLVILGYTFPALKGNSIQFSCASGIQVSGVNSSTCTENGEWDPDLSEVKCKGKK